jgi:signal transduction histidine kinase
MRRHWHDHHHHYRKFRPLRMSWLGWYVRARLHRRLFMWFGFSIVLTAVAVGAVMVIASRSGIGPRSEEFRLKRLVGDEFAAVWTDTARREELANAIARDLDVDLTVSDARTGERRSFGQQDCVKPWGTADVRSGDTVLGQVGVCAQRHTMGSHWVFLWPLLFLLMLLWGGSGRIARRIARPLSELARVAADLGAGKLSSRARVDWRASEIAVLAEVFNEMANRIERQIADQRELLAGVSHELRTPLARIRLLIELLREGAAQNRLDEIEREVVEIDALVGELLASSRLDFAALVPKPLDAADVARRALDRANLPADVLQVSGDTAFEGDPTLMARALANLLDNARKHAGGVARVRVEGRDDRISFEVEDNGPGIPTENPDSIFRPFAPPPDGKPREQGSLGLGLSLVRRIAEAHGGKAFAANRDSGGARIGFEVSRHRPAADAPPRAARMPDPSPAPTGH